MPDRRQTLVKAESKGTAAKGIPALWQSIKPCLHETCGLPLELSSKRIRRTAFQIPLRAAHPKTQKLTRGKLLIVRGEGDLSVA